MNIKPYDKTIKELLISGRQFVIPRFQREYSWDKKNYQEFFNDMLGNVIIEKNKLSPQPYFLGTMLFVGDYTDGDNQHIDVVDGQQRMTTITILFSAISDRFRELSENVLSEQLFKYIMTKNDDGDEVRILKSKTHYPFFSFFIQDIDKAKSELPTTEEEHCIEETYKFLYDALDETRLRTTLKKRFGDSEVDSLKYVEILKAIRDQILGSIFVSISTTDKKQANKIFEILNGKGKKLADIDLIKNSIFDVLSKTEPADFAEEKWNKVKSNLSSNNENIGLATFFHHYWNSCYSKATKKSLYDNFRKKIVPNNAERYEQFLLEIEVASSIYMKIISPNRSDYDNRKEYYWLVQSLNVLSNYFNIVQIRIVLLALFYLKDQDLVSSKTFKRTVLFLENFHFAYNAIMKNRPNRIESIYSKFAIAVRKAENKSDANNIIDEHLIKPITVLFPTYSDFEEKFIKLSYSKKETPTNVIAKYAINKLSCCFDTTEVFYDDSTIEHIVCEKTGASSLNIGNLLLLESTLNAKAGELLYNEKINVYCQSKYNMVLLFIERYPEWNANLIEERAKDLAKKYYYDILGLPE